MFASFWWYYKQNFFIFLILSLCVGGCIHMYIHSSDQAYVCACREQRTTSNILPSHSHAYSLETGSLKYVVQYVVEVEFLIFQLGWQPANSSRIFLSLSPLSAGVTGEHWVTHIFYMGVGIQIQVLMFHNKHSYPSFQPFSHLPSFNTGFHYVAIVGLEFSM